MRQREKDLQKVISYAKLLDIKVEFNKSLDGDEVGNYYPREGSSPPTIYLSKKDRSTFSQMLTLLHELGHHIDARERGWIDTDYKALELVFDKLHLAPEWAKKRFWDLEEYANWNALQTALHLEIKLPPFYFWYDMEKGRRFIELEFEIGKIPKKMWREEKRKIRHRLLEYTPSLESYKILSY